MENTDGNVESNTQNQSVKKYQVCIFVLSVGLIFVIFIALMFSSEKNQCRSNLSNTLFDLNRCTQTTTSSPSPTYQNSQGTNTSTSAKKRQSANLDVNDTWDRYHSTCSGLSGIDVYYPLSWKFGSEGEQRVSDGPSDSSNECLIQFGYPFAPGGRQDSFVSNQIAEIRISAYSTNKTNLNDLLSANVDSFQYLDNYSDFTVASYKKTDIHGVAYLMGIEVNSSNLASFTKHWSSIHNGMIYQIDLSVLDAENIDPISMGQIVNIGDTLVEKIIYH